MFCPIMQNKIMCKSDCAEIVTEKFGNGDFAVKLKKKGLHP